MKAKALINDESVQIVLEAEGQLEMGFLKRFVNGKTGNGHGIGAGYTSNGNTHHYGYESISLVIYDAKPKSEGGINNG